MITTQDKRALRHADRWVWRLYDGQSTLEAYREAHSSSTGFEERHVINAETVIHDHSASHYSGHAAENYTAFHMDYRRPELATILDALTPGATLTLFWVMGNDNENTRDAGWRRDELHAKITPAKGKTRDFLVAVQVGPMNTASMMHRVH